MKFNKLKNILMLVVFFAGVNELAYSQKANTKDTLNFKVYGNCGMCKSTIETALDVKGVVSSDWDVETKMIRVVFNKTKITEEKIHQLIAGVGYDTEKNRSKDEIYNELHPCCKYERNKEKP